MTKDELYPVTKDTTRDRSKTYYLHSGCSMSEADESCFDANGEFFAPDDPFWDDWNGKGVYTYEEMEELGLNKYCEKNEELAGDEAQGAAGGGGGGCGGGGGGCGGKAANQEKKNETKNKLSAVDKAAKAAMSVSANPEDLLKGLISIATAVLDISGLLQSLITPELLGQATQIIDSTQQLLSDAMDSAVNSLGPTMDSLGQSMDSAMSTAMEGVSSALSNIGPMAGPRGSRSLRAGEANTAKEIVMATMREANNMIGKSFMLSNKNMGTLAKSALDMARDLNATLNGTMDKITKTASSLDTSMDVISGSIEANLSNIVDVIREQVGDTPEARAAISAVASAQTSINNAIATTRSNVSNSFNVASILGVAS